MQRGGLQPLPRTTQAAAAAANSECSTEQKEFQVNALSLTNLNSSLRRFWNILTAANMATLFRCGFAASAITTVCCVCLLAIFNGTFRSQCIDSTAGSNGMRAIVVLFVAAAALAFVANAAFVLKRSPKRGGAVIAAICSKWQPVYFIAVSVEKLVLRAIMISYNTRSVSERAGHCLLHDDFYHQFHAAAFMWDCTIALAGVWTICCDLDADFTPLMRRLAQCLLALYLIADATMAYVWGNQIVFRDRVSVSVGSFQLVLDSQVTSCIQSQAVIALHFVYVSWRSRRGRGWAYAPLRFELVESGRACRSSMSQMMRQGLNERRVSASESPVAPESGATCEDLRSESEATCTCGPFTGLSQGLVRFQKLRESQCRVFVIPCVARHDEGTGRRDAEFGLSRPAFDMRWLRPLQRLADANTKRYISILVGCFALPSFVFSIFLHGEVRGIVCLILNSACVVMILGFFSSKQYNLDKEAVKHVAMSFRFAIIAALLVFWIFLNTRRAFKAYVVPGSTAADNFWFSSALFAFCVAFSFIMLFDCVPQLPAIAQIVVTVRGCSHASAHSVLKFIFLFQFLFFACFGYWISTQIRRLSAGEDPDCFVRFGTFELCDATQNLSIYSTLFLLQAQALICRVLVPGMSIFVNASVRRLLWARSFIMFECVTPRTL
jgi:hypothetical protein